MADPHQSEALSARPEALMEREELRELLASARELIRWEEELSGLLPAGEGGGQARPQTTKQATRTSDAAEGAANNGLFSAQEKIARLKVLAEEAAACVACPLHHSRTRSVFARGAPDAEVAFVGEGPGWHEDQQGLPFVGPAGQLLDKMIGAMGLQPESVYICNIVKCRPPENRTPLPNEAGACSRFLHEQLTLVAPKVIVALGRCAAENLGCAEPGARGWRGVWGSWNGIDTMPTYHPAFLLRSPQFKRPVWEDLQKVMAKLA